MSNSSQDSTVQNEILQWSLGRPIWQRDALRRLVENGALEGKDIEELCSICMTEHGFPLSGPNAVPLNKDHLPSEKSTAGAVSLSCIRDVRKVNALAPGQILKFSSAGLTIVYGDNASGKSGYARILKRACRARARGRRILGNVFEAVQAEPASATLEYFVDGTKETISWLDDETEPPVLSAVSVFDTECATVHVREANDLAFTPFGLDLFEKLASACKLVRARLEMIHQKFTQDQPESLRQPRVGPTTRVGREISQLNWNTNIKDLEAMAVLSATELKRLEELRSIRDQDPSRLAGQLRAFCQRLKQLFTALQQVGVRLSDDSLAKLQQARNDATAATEAARTAATVLFQEEPLPDIGGEIWKELWNSAQRYSANVAYPGEIFPLTRPGSRCVLCQQLLSDDASARLVRFERFVRADTQQRAEKATATCQLLAQDIRAADLRRSIFSPILKELLDYDDAVSTLARRFYIGAWLRKRALIRACKSGNFDQVPALLPATDQVLTGLLQKLSSQIAELEQAAKAAGRAALLQELAELEDRVWLSSVLRDVDTDNVRLAAIEMLNGCIRDTDTTAISLKAGSLTEAAVTVALRELFAKETTRFNIRHMSLTLAPAGSRHGSMRYQIRLVDAPEAELDKIVSEGEHRCLAIAAFLTELATSSHKSALVFDDPVSSLDHLHRESLAKRLAEEALVRQVIVFTHDLVFAFFLDKTAHSLGIEPFQQFVYRNSSYAGLTDVEAPLRAKPVRECISYLTRRAKEISGLFESGQGTKYEEQARALYGRLRETWEAAVAEVLQPVISRFDRDVDTKNLRKISVITENHCQAVDEQRAKCSRYQHNESAAVNEPPPVPQTVLADIEALPLG